MGIKNSQEIIRGAYRLLRRPSQRKLPYQDMLDALNNLCLGYVQDKQLSPREQRTAVAIVVPQYDDVLGDYILDMQDVPDFEPLRLEVGSQAGWYNVNIYPYTAWAQHYSDGEVCACFYGSDDIESGLHVKINRAPESVGNSEWRLSYREPLLTVLQLGDRPPMPTAFSPMLEFALALEGMTLCIDESPEWERFVDKHRPFLAAKLDEWHQRFDRHLNQSVEPQIQNARRMDRRRGQGITSPRGYLPLR